MNHGTARLAAVFARLLDNPRTPEEMQARWDEVEQAEARVRQLQQVALKERGDVEALQNPLWRLGAWLGGDLAERELREQREYAAALGQVLQGGARAQDLREQVQALPPFPTVDDGVVAEAFAGVQGGDLGFFGPLEPALIALWNRAQRWQQLVDLVALLDLWHQEFGLRTLSTPSAASIELEEELRRKLIEAEFHELEASMTMQTTMKRHGDLTPRGVKLALGRQIPGVIEGLALATLAALRDRGLEVP